MNEEITVTLTLETNIGLFGNFGSFPIKLQSKATGKSEMCIMASGKDIAAVISQWVAAFEDSIDTGDIYRYMKRVLGLRLENGKYVKYSGAVTEYQLSGLEVEVRNAPFAPISPEGEQPLK